MGTPCDGRRKKRAVGGSVGFGTHPEGPRRGPGCPLNLATRRPIDIPKGGARLGLTIQTHHEAPDAVVALSGFLDENAELDQLDARGCRTLALDLSGLTRCNSIGLLKWARFVKSIPESCTVELQCCSTAITKHFNLYPAALAHPRLRVTSVHAPFVCGECGEETEILVELADAVSEPELPGVLCRRCANPMELDGAADRQFLFVRRGASGGAPTRDQPAERPVVTATPSQRHGDLGELSILVVDDEPDIVEILGSVLQELGCEIISAFDGAAALNVVKSRQVDAIISDLMMPEMDGLTLLRQLRAEGYLLPFVILTGHGDQTSTVNALRLGAFDFLSKPFDSDAVVNTMRQALQNAAAMRADRSSQSATEVDQYGAFVSRYRDASRQSGLGSTAVLHFATNTEAQCQFAVAAIAALAGATPEHRRLELAYLTRVAQSIHHAIEALKISEWLPVTDATVTLLSQLRVTRRPVSEADVVTVSVLFNWLHDAAACLAKSQQLASRISHLVALARGAS